MVNKRPFHDEGIYEVACKNPRHQADSEPGLYDGIARCDSPQNLPSDGGEISTRKHSDEEKTASETSSEDLNEAKEELQRNASSSNGNAKEEYVDPDSVFHASFFPQLFEVGLEETILAQHHDIYPFLMEQAPQRFVPVGPENQAIIPEWKIHGATKSSGSYVNDNVEKLLGTCLIPMPDMESFAYSSSGDKRTGKVCNCRDRGSLTCVELHITEAREELREELGQKFGRLGLCDMGEEIARKWSSEEERSFLDTVRSNPASKGKNFWHVLTSVFPTRTKQELVNYYFNVLVLRRRAMQNRLDPRNVDSDDDEWIFFAPGVSDLADDDDDSPAESFDQNAPAHDQENHEVEDHSVVESFDQFGLPRDHGWEDKIEMEGQKDVLKGGVGLVDGDDISLNVADSGTNGLFQFPGKISSAKGEDHDAGDDSCMSYENQSSKLDSCGPVDSGVHDRDSS